MIVASSPGLRVHDVLGQREGSESALLVAALWSLFCIAD